MKPDVDNVVDRGGAARRITGASLSAPVARFHHGHR